MPGKMQQSDRLLPEWSPTGKLLAPLGFADSLRERRGLVVRHPDHKRSGLKPWLSAVGVKVPPFSVLFGLILTIQVFAAESPDELYRQGRFTEAEKAYASSSMDHPKDLRYRYNRGCAAYQNEDYQASSAAFSSVLRRAEGDETRFKAAYNLGNAAYKQGDFASAAAHYRSAIVYNPENEDAKHNLELALTELEKLKQQEDEEPTKEPQGDADQKEEAGNQSKTANEGEEADKPSQEGGSDQEAPQDRDQQDKQSQTDKGQKEESEQNKDRRPEGTQKAEEESPQDLSGELKPLKAETEKEKDGETPTPQVSMIDKKKAEALLDNIKEDRSRFLQLQVPEGKKHGLSSGKDW